MNAIYKRRSIRHYTDKEIPVSELEELVKAGMNAPSAGNQQPWHFIIINSRDILDRIPDVHPYSSMVLEAPAAILVCGDLELEKHRGFWVQDCSAATENILIMAAHMGLGSVWLGVYPREERVDGLRDMLNIPEHIIPFALLPVGFPAEDKPEKNIFDKSRIRYNRW